MQRTKNQNLTLPEVAELLGDSQEQLAEWATAGMPECAGKAGTYDFPVCLYWVLGQNLWKQAERIGVTMTAAHKVAAGWLLSPGPSTESRREEIALYLSNLERSGIDMPEALAALHWAMGAFDALGLYAGRVLREDGMSGKAVSTH